MAGYLLGHLVRGIPVPLASTLVVHHGCNYNLALRYSTMEHARTTTAAAGARECSARLGSRKPTAATAPAIFRVGAVSSLSVPLYLPLCRARPLSSSWGGRAHRIVAPRPRVHTQRDTARGSPPAHADARGKMGHFFFTASASRCNSFASESI